MKVDWQTLAEHPDMMIMPTSLRECANETQVRAGQVVARIGSRPRYMYFVRQGELRLRRLSVQGNEIVLQRCLSGFVAEASLESSAYHCDIAAGKDSSLISFPIPAFRKSLGQDEPFCRTWMEHLAHEARSLRARCERLALRTASERIQHYIESEGHNGTLELRQTRKAWAAELGLTHEALYRTLAVLVANGVIALSQQHEHLTVAVVANFKR